MKMKNKVVVITGGSSGIGEAAGKLFATEGAKVALLARTTASLDRAAAEIEAAGGDVRAYSLDVRDTAKAEEVFGQIEKDLGPLDVLLNCAGVYYPTPGGDMDEQAWRQMLDINVGGTINTCNAVLPGMKARRTGHIVNIASVAAIAAVSGFSVYCASKAAIVMLSRSLAAEFAPFGIHINIIAPGNTATPMNQDFRTDPDSANALKNMEAATPSLRTFSKPHDIAQSALFLVSEGGAPFYGAVFVADEGLSLEVDVMD